MVERDSSCWECCRKRKPMASRSACPSPGRARGSLLMGRVAPHLHIRWSRFARPPAARGSLDSRLGRSSSRTPFSRPRYVRRSLFETLPAHGSLDSRLHRSSSRTPCSWVVSPHSHVRWSPFGRPPDSRPRYVRRSLFETLPAHGSLDSRLHRSSSRTPFSRPRYVRRSLFETLPLVASRVGRVSLLPASG